MKVHTKETQSSLTPNMALSFLEEGNHRFVNNLKINRNLLQQVNESRDGQWPFATILNCIDSRISPELIFDQGVGDIFTIRIAGNIINEDILGSMEFATKVSGSKLILVLGHNKCGAIKGAYDNVDMGNLTTLLSKIEKPINDVERELGPRDTVDKETFLDAIARQNVLHSIQEILDKSPILAQMLADGEIDIAGGMYSIDTGLVEFFHLEQGDINDVTMTSSLSA